MLSETVVSTLLLTSITGAGLVLALYALITPISDKIFKGRAKKLESLLEEFQKEIIKAKADVPNADIKHLKQLRNEIKAVRDFPRYLGIGIVITFVFFAFSFIDDALYFFAPTPSIYGDYLTEVLFIVAILSFAFVGIYVVLEIDESMRKEFEDIKKKQKEAKKYVISDGKVYRKKLRGQS